MRKIDLSHLSFDSEMTYWQTLRIVARGLIQWPVGHDDLTALWEGIKDVLYYGLAPIARLLALITLPISAPIFAWIVQIERKKTAKRIADRKEKMRADIHRNERTE